MYRTIKVLNATLIAANCSGTHLRLLNTKYFFSSEGDRKFSYPFIYTEVNGCSPKLLCDFIHLTNNYIKIFAFFWIIMELSDIPIGGMCVFLCRKPLPQKQKMSLFT